jgi:cell division protein FtsI/penicillin-binding protein 2
MNKKFAFRIRILLIAIVCIAIIFILKLFQVQVVQHEYYLDRADRQYIRPNYSIFDRGSIFFTTRDGEKVPAAKVNHGFLLAIKPSAVTDPIDAYEKLNKIIDIDKERFLKSASKIDDPYEEILDRISNKEKDEIVELDIDGVSLYKKSWRHYPADKRASSTIGFLSYDKDDNLSAQYGLEKYYDDTLKRDTDNVYVNFFVEIFTSFKDNVINGAERPGDIITTIEPTVQSTLEKELKGISDKHLSKSVGGIVMDPNTGEIIALGSYPNFNLNEYGKSSLSILSNPIVENVYELGSIVKPLTMAIGLDSGKITPDTIYNDTGSRELNGHTFWNYDKRARGEGTSMQDVLNNSLNVGAAHIAVDKVGVKEFKEYMLKLIGEETGIDLPHEQAPLVSNLNNGKDIEYATASFGQGIAVTPIIMIRALSALANGGYLVDPHLVSEIDYEVGLKKVVSNPDPEQVFSNDTSEKISRMLVSVVDEALLGGTVSKERYSIAAKTGTAQLVDSTGKYSEDKYLHSFFGYFPAYEPRFIILLFTLEPKGEDYASHTLTLPFINLTDFLLNYYNIPPDR